MKATVRKDGVRVQAHERHTRPAAATSADTAAAASAAAADALSTADTGLHHPHQEMSSLVRDGKATSEMLEAFDAEWFAQLPRRWTGAPLIPGAGAAPAPVKKHLYPWGGWATQIGPQAWLAKRKGGEMPANPTRDQTHRSHWTKEAPDWVLIRTDSSDSSPPGC